MKGVLIFLPSLQIIVTTACAILLPILANSSNDSSNGRGIVESENCYIYLGPSSIQGAGMGVYVNRSFKKGELIMSSNYGNIIPIMDPYVNPNHSKWTRLFNNYIWAQPTGASNELKYEAKEVIDMQLGLGMFPNSHSVLHNLGFTFPETTYEEKPSTESSSLGSGAFTRHKGRNFIALRDIKEGEELFFNYGDAFFDSRPSSLSHVPRRQDFVIASNLIKAIKVELSEAMLLLTNSEDIVSSTTRKKITEDIVAKMLSISCASLQYEVSGKSRICAMIPKSLDELERVFRHSNEVAEFYKDVKDPLTFSLALTSLERRDINWIEENGFCLDTLFVAKSNIPNAGNGIMSKRHVKEGGLIATMPLLQIPDKALLSTFQAVIGNNKIAHDFSQSAGSQLLLNYCFGDNTNKLPILLCPTSNAIFANHCSDSFNCVPNAYFQWSNNNKTNEWLTFSLDEIAVKNEWGLSFDLIAERDITNGEEIFVDYGKEWVEAWNDYAKHVHEVLTKEEHQNQDNMNRMKDDTFTGCLFWEKDNEKWPYLVDIDLYEQNWSEVEDEILLDHFAKDGSDYFVKNNSTTKVYWPCKIIRDHRNDKHPRDMFTVRLFQPHWQKQRWIDGDTIPRFLINYPVSSVKPFTKPYSSELHHLSAFRHHIGIPAKMIPEKWKTTEKMESNGPGLDVFNVGERVVIDVENDSKWYSATIMSIDDSRQGLYTILHDDGETIQRVSSTTLQRPTKTLYTTSVHPYL